MVGGEHRIQIHFRNLGEIRNQRRDAFDHAGQGRAVDRLGAAHAAQDLSRLDAVQHRQRIRVGRGREPERNVLQDFDQDAAEPEGNEFSERRIGNRADDDFLAEGYHLLNLHAEDFRLRVVLLCIADDGVERFFGVLRRLHADDDAARLGLVQDLRRDDFHDHRKADIRRELCRLIGRLRDAFLRNGDSISLANAPRLGRSQGFAARSLGGLQNFTNAVLFRRLDFVLHLKFLESGAQAVSRALVK